MIKKQGTFYALNSSISKSSRTMKEISNLVQEVEKTDDKEEKKLIDSQIQTLKKSLQKTMHDLGVNIQGLSLVAPLKKAGVERPMFKPLSTLSTLTPPISSKAKAAPGAAPGARAATPAPAKPSQTKEQEETAEESLEKFEKKEVEDVERETLKRMKGLREERAKKKPSKRKIKKASFYVKLSNSFFSGFSESLLKKGHFKGLKRTLVKANMQFLTKSYISVMFFTTFLSAIIALMLFAFFLFYNFGVMFPFITPARQDILERALNIFWFFIFIPVITYVIAYLYPSIERKSLEMKISQELPFATIHMAAIAESMIEPSNIFHIMVKSPDYPALKKEFTQLINEINLFGRDLVTALRNSAMNSPSRKLAELFDGLGTTITSGGDLSDFFEKRAQSLLFDYKLEKEKKTKSAETFMDIYISVVIAAPMILMLLLIMMRVSGLGIALSTGMISLIMVAGVSFVNVIFLIFLHLKSPAAA